MEKYSILLSYFDKQIFLINKIYFAITSVDVSIYENRYVFSLKTQQFYTALEDLFKQIAKAFENHIEEMSQFHKEILQRMTLDIPRIRPAVLSSQSKTLLEKILAFRHFVRHAYDCEFDMKELQHIQNKLRLEYSSVETDLKKFQAYLRTLTSVK